jgi:hypothetical protein
MENALLAFRFSTFVPPTDHLIGKRRDATRIFYRSGGLTPVASTFDSRCSRLNVRPPRDWRGAPDMA